MRKLWHALPTLLIGATLLAPIRPAAAGWSCSYYRWDSPAQKWDLVARLQPQAEFRRTHVLGVDYHCEYCYVPAAPPRDPDTFDGVDDVKALAAETLQTVQEAQLPVPAPGSVSPVGMNPWDGPACPLVPPVWDEGELGVIGPIG
jgi:hypothetical protein